MESFEYSVNGIVWQSSNVFDGLLYTFYQRVKGSADTSADGGISITDFIQIKAAILDKGTITPN